MTRERLNNLAELNYLWKRRGNKNYNLISVISSGNFAQHMVFEDRQNNRKVVGKMVTSPREGEAYHWPRLLHENLAPLLEIVAINEVTSVYIFQTVGSSLRNVIHEDSFRNDPDCFDRKKAYAEDILWALDYLHQTSLCIMNLTERIIYICDVADKAVICDFSCVVLIQRASKERMQLPVLYQAPEVNSEYFLPVKVETWTCGVMLLQVFTQHRLPSVFIGNEVHPILKSVTEINYDVIKEANPGSSLRQSDIVSLKSFLGLFLTEDPNQRADVQIAAVSSFLRHSKRKSPNGNGGTRNRFEESNTNALRSFKTTSERERGFLEKSTTFEDIYRKEAATHKTKLKRFSSANKFISLEYVRNRIEGESPVEKPYDVGAIGDKKETIPKAIKNEFHNLYSKSDEENNTNFELAPNYSGRNSVDNAFQNLYADTRKCYSDVEKLREYVTDCNSDQFAPGDDFVSDENQLQESKLNSPYETAVSTDSLDTLVSTEIDLPEKLDTHKDEMKSKLHKKKNEACSYSQSETRFSKDKPEANLYSIRSESNMKNFYIKNTNLASFRSDSCLVDSLSEKHSEAETGLSVSKVLSSNPDTNILMQMTLDSSSTYKESDSEVEYKRHRKLHLKGVAHRHINDTIAPTPSIDSLSLNGKNRTTVTKFYLHQNGCNSARELHSLNDENTLKRDDHNKQTTENPTFLLRRNSYKQAVSNGVKDSTKHRGNKLWGRSKVEKNGSKSLFRKKKPNPTKRQNKTRCSLPSSINMQDSSKSKSDPCNMDFFVSSDLGSMETSLLDATTRKGATKKAKKTWIQCLCLGSKTYQDQK